MTLDLDAIERSAKRSAEGHNGPDTRVHLPTSTVIELVEKAREADWQRQRGDELLETAKGLIVCGATASRAADAERKLADRLAAALSELQDWQNGLPLETYDPPFVEEGRGWTAAMRKADEALAAHEEARKVKS